MSTALDQMPHDKTRRLAGVQPFGDVTVRPGGKVLVEELRNEPVDLEGTITHESWPIIVEGKTAEDVHLEHDAATALRVVRVAVLLSLAWDEPWTVRTSPKRSVALPPRVPAPWPPVETECSGSLAEALIEVGDATLPLDLPSWSARAWRVMDADRHIENAAHCWQQGLLMLPSYPSFAAGAFVSAVDALTHSPWAQRCRDVPKRGKVRERIRALLQPELGGPDAGRLFDCIYDGRNSTFHEAHLAGFETSLWALSAMSLVL